LAAKASTAVRRVERARRIEFVYVLLVGWRPRVLCDATDAIACIEGFDDSRPDRRNIRYEVGVRYNNGDEIRGQFGDKATTIAFLRGIR